MPEILITIGSVVLLFFVTVIALASRYKRCPPDKILVIYGKTGVDKSGMSGRCYHGGGAFVWPIIQDYQFLDLTPSPIDIQLQGALSQQNIRVNTPSTFTVGISTEPGIMENAAEQEAETARAKTVEATKYADIVVPAMVEKQRIETIAEAEAEQIRRLEKGKADGIRSVMEAEAGGLKAQLSAKAEGFREVVNATNGNADLSALMLMIEQLPALVAEQVKAISNLKIDKVTVWDGGGKDGKNGTADFLSGLAGSLPPLHELTGNVGVKLPEFLGKMNLGESGEATVPEEASPKISVSSATTEDSGAVDESGAPEEDSEQR